MKTMKRFWAWIEWIMPRYTYVPAIAVVLCNTLAYYGSKLLAANAVHHDLSIGIDAWLPFVPFFVSFYVLAYVQWFWNYIFHGRLGREICYHIVTADVIAKLICMVFFLALPTEIDRPEITGGGIWNFLTGLIYASDTPRNLFPSIHCLESWLCFRASLLVKGAPRWYAPFQFVFTLGVFASTVLIKQHFVIDILAGVAVVEIGWFLSKKLSLWRVFEKIELPSVRRARMTEQKECEAEVTDDVS